MSFPNQTEPCEKCNREIRLSAMHIHKPFCDKVPPKEDLKRYMVMSYKMIGFILGVCCKTLKPHCEAIGLTPKKGEICNRCSRRIQPQNKQGHDKESAACKSLKKYYCKPICTAYDIRHELQENILHMTVKQMAEMYQTNEKSLITHIKALCIKTLSVQERRKQQAEKRFNNFVNGVDVPREYIELALKYYSVEVVFNEMGINRDKCVRYVRQLRIGIPKSRDRCKNVNDFYKDHKGKPLLKMLLKGQEIAMKPEKKCKRCDMLIYDNASKLPVLGMEIGLNRAVPSIINHWTQQAIKLEKSVTFYELRLVNKYKKNGRYGKYRRGKVVYDKGDYCRFCVAELTKKPAPLAPDWTMMSSNVLETATTTTV